MSKHTRVNLAEPLQKNIKTNKIIAIALVYLAAFAFCYIAGVLSTIPTSSSVKVGDISPQTYTASKDVVDEYSTELAREEAMAKVDAVYKLDSSVTQDTLDKISADFSAAEQVRQSARTLYLEQTNESESSFSPDRIDWDVILTQSIVSNLKQKLSEYITDENVYAIAASTQSQLLSLKTDLTSLVSNRMSSGLTQDDTAEFVNSLASVLTSEKNYSPEMADLAANIAGGTIKANKIFDSETTESSRKAAADAVSEVVYKTGQNIVQKGDVITEANYNLMMQLGIISDGQSHGMRWLSGGILMLVIYGSWILYMFILEPKLRFSFRANLSLALLMFICVAIEIVVKSLSLLATPVFLPVLVASAFMRKRSAITLGTLMSIMICYLTTPSDGMFFCEENMRMLTASILGVFAAVLTLRKRQNRGEFVAAGAVAGCVNVLIYLCFCILDGRHLSSVVHFMLMGLLNGLAAGFVSVGLLPVWERVFSLDTPMQLLEIANPTAPLLKRLMIEAPGTYHHSMMVANLAEAGAEAIGADALLVRVASYYHDIGKIGNPQMFKENQLHTCNPHDSMPPQESAKLIIRHVSKGVELAERYKLPRRVVDIIKQHHGTSLALFFYYKAKELDENVKEEIFRYNGPRPNTREAGILMLADVVEAAVRANKSAQKGELEDHVSKLIKSKQDDGQLDDCPLSRPEIRAIEHAFIGVFRGANYQRIKYPGDEKRNMRRATEDKHETTM